MSIPSPSQLQATLNDIDKLTEKIGPLWRWLEPNAFARAKHTGLDGGNRASSEQCRACGGIGKICDRCHSRLSGDGICPNCATQYPVECPECGSDGAFIASDDQVGGVVIATEAFRTKLRHAAREVLDARTRLRGALADLSDATRLIEPKDTTTDQPTRSLPHPANRGDLDRARKAQDRRQRRAHESGDWSEVTG